MDLEELKKIRKANILAHKKKKKAYYLKSKQSRASLENNASSENDISKNSTPAIINYEDELFSGNFTQKIKDIAKKQKTYVDDRKEIILAKMQEYKEKKQQYYIENKQDRLEYDKEYREKRKEDLKAYRKEYYKKNKEKILAKQKESRQNKTKQRLKDGI